MQHAKSRNWPFVPTLTLSVNLSRFSWLRLHAKMQQVSDVIDDTAVQVYLTKWPENVKPSVRRVESFISDYVMQLWNLSAVYLKDLSESSWVVQLFRAHVPSCVCWPPHQQRKDEELTRQTRSPSGSPWLCSGRFSHSLLRWPNHDLEDIRQTTSTLHVLLPGNTLRLINLQLKHFSQ